MSYSHGEMLLVGSHNAPDMGWSEIILYVNGRRPLCYGNTRSMGFRGIRIHVRKEFQSLSFRLYLHYSMYLLQQVWLQGSPGYYEQTVHYQTNNLSFNAIFNKKSIPVGNVPPAHNHMRGSPWQRSPRQGPPGQRPHLDRDLPDRDPLDRDPPYRNSPEQRPQPGQGPPGQRPPWTETPLDTDPLDRDHPGQRPQNAKTLVSNNRLCSFVTKRINILVLIISFVVLT